MIIIDKIKLVARAGKYKNRQDVVEIQYILDQVESGQTVFDIGAHKGGYLYHFVNKVGRSGKVYAFEPQTVLYNYLVRMKAAFKWDNVIIDHKALSDINGAASLYIPANHGRPSSPGASIVSSENFGDYKTEEITTETLDSYCLKNDIKPDFLKIDVEGNELKVFKGGMAVLSKYRPKILFECEERHIGKEKVLETFQFLESLGYKGKFIKGAEIVPLDTFDFILHQTAGREPYCNNFIFE